MGFLRYGDFKQPVVGEEGCGDACCVVERETYVVVVVADGLGHGPDAELAARGVIAAVEANPDQPPGPLLRKCHEALKGTRGAAVGIARIDLPAKQLVYSGIGNIEARIVGGAGVVRPVSSRGIVGQNPFRNPRTETFPFHPGAILIMHSDGISDRFEISPASIGREPQQIASQIAYQFGKTQDDQLILVLSQEVAP